MTLKGADIPEYNPALPEDQKDKVIQDSLKAVKRAMDQTGAGLLVGEVKAVLTTLTSATSTIVPTYSKAFVTSGGLVEIDFKTMVAVSAATAIVLMQVDDQVVDMLGLTTTDAFIWLGYKSNLAAGEHKVSIWGSKAGGGALQLGANSSLSALWIKETLL